MITVNAKIKSTCPTGDFTVTCCIGISNGLRVSSLILFTNICMKNARNYFNTFSILLFQNANYDMVVTQIEQCVVSSLDTFAKSYQWHLMPHHLYLQEMRLHIEQLQHKQYQNLRLMSYVL